MSDLQKRVPDVGIMENFFKGRGRLNRLRYLKRMVAVDVVGMVAWTMIILAVGALLGAETLADSKLELYVLQFIVGVPILCTDFQLKKRRLQDLDRGDMIAKISMFIYAALMFVPLDDENGKIPAVVLVMMAASIVSVGISLYLFFAAGTKGENQYGPDPLE